MLVIKNIDKLEHQKIGNWIVKGIDVDQQTNLYTSHNYIIRLHRSGKGAAIIIERKEGEFGYNVSLCYKEYGNIISITPWPKDRLLGKVNFLVSMQGLLDAEYDKTH
jgi:hypothetical protein